jgi:hypothetical protein
MKLTENELQALVVLNDSMMRMLLGWLIGRYWNDDEFAQNVRDWMEEYGIENDILL